MLSSWYFSFGGRYISFLACSLTGSPTLPELLKFTCAGKTINIVKEIGNKYKYFGTFLLEDNYGQKVTSMESQHHSDSSKINTLILEEWLNGRGKQPVTWATLVEVLRDTELFNLANDISMVKCQTFEEWQDENASDCAVFPLCMVVHKYINMTNYWGRKSHINVVVCVSRWYFVALAAFYITFGFCTVVNFVLSVYIMCYPHAPKYDMLLSR